MRMGVYLDPDRRQLLYEYGSVIAALDYNNISRCLRVVEHKDRLTRFGFRYIETLLEVQGRSIEVVNAAENDKEDLLHDLASIIYAFCARLYGQRRAKRKTERLVEQFQARMTPMQLVEQHLIRRSDPRYAAIDQAAFASKNLYNQATYQIRQAYIHEGTYLPYAEVFHRVKHLECYQALPHKVSNSILILIDKNWRSFQAALKEWYEHPEKFTGRPKLPGYKHKEKGRNILIYDMQAISKKALKRGMISPSGLGIEIPTKQTRQTIDQVRIVPRLDGYLVEVVYRKEEDQAAVDPSLVAALDLGVNTLAAVTSTKQGFQPLLVNSRPLKSLNQHYNQQRAHHQSHLAKAKRFTSRQLDRITTKRNRRVSAYLHTASCRVIDHLVTEGIGTLVVGKNPLWKQEVEMGRKNNQEFVQIPHARFIDLLTYKAKLVGIQVVLQEESYTSKASFLDRDPIAIYAPERKEQPRFSGKREKRGLYRASDGRRINADINGSYNILRKAFPHSFGQGIEAPAVVPRRLAV
jgi:putative transposase